MLIQDIKLEKNKFPFDLFPSNFTVVVCSGSNNDCILKGDEEKSDYLFSQAAGVSLSTTIMGKLILALLIKYHFDIESFVNYFLGFLLNKF